MTSTPPALRPVLKSALHPNVHLSIDPTSPTSGSSSGLPSAASASSGFPRTQTGNSTNDGKYRRKVGFETFEAAPESLFTFTAQAKSEGYKRSRNTRVFLVAVSPDESGEDALDWLMTELVEDGDEVVAMRVVDIGEHERHSESCHDQLREEAQELLATVLAKNDEEDGRKISAVVEIVVGHVNDMILKMIALYRPDTVVVGTKGQRSRMQVWGKALGAPGMGSISRFAVSHSPVPVIVVRPERKVKKTQQRREAAGKRGQYAALIGPDDMTLSRSRSRDDRSRSRDRSGAGSRAASRRGSRASSPEN